MAEERIGTVLKLQAEMAMAAENAAAAAAIEAITGGRKEEGDGFG